MSAVIIATLLVLTVLLGGVAGGVIIRKAAPAFMRAPRVAVGVLLATLSIWLVGFAALGPMLAWGLSGPSHLMPGNAGEVCQRCLAAANPLPPGLEVETFMPAILLLALPLLLVFVMLLSGYRYFRRTRKQRHKLSEALRMGATHTHVAGHPVTMLAHDQPTAFAVADRSRGIVVSTALVELLTPEELAAVVTHEAAHLRQHHHLILNIVHGAMAPLRWIPLVAAISSAIPHYLEMAADNAARDHTSTPVLASALLKLGEKTGPARTQHGSVALHAAGLDRIRHLISPPDSRRAAVPLSALSMVVGMLVAGSAVVHLPYLQAILDGCLI